MDSERKSVLKRLKLTRRNETVCLMWWEVKILLDWIEENERRNEHEQTDDHRKPDPRS